MEWSSLKRRLPAPVRTAARKIYQQTQWLERAQLMARAVLTREAGHQVVHELVTHGVGAAGKIGESELCALASYLKYRDGNGFAARWTPRTRRLYTNAGVFPDNVLAYNAFVRTMGQALSHLDVLAVWYNRGEAKVVKEFAPQAQLVGLTCLEPHLWQEPWFSSLRDKRVLVVSPFVDTIRSQLPRMPDVWQKRPQMAVAFELLTIRTPFCAAIEASPYRDWQAGLDHLRREMDATNFDVAIIGAGAWSVPLAVHAKHLGRVGIHLGGATQLLFGVTGRRWDNNPKHKPFMNDAWVRPTERPALLSNIEDGCYW